MESVGGCGVTSSRMGRVGAALGKPLAWLCSLPIVPARLVPRKDREQGFPCLLSSQRLAQCLERLDASATLPDPGSPLWERELGRQG